jgi:hypothetical protein
MWSYTKCENRWLSKQSKQSKQSNFSRILVAILTGSTVGLWVVSLIKTII